MRIGGNLGGREEGVRLLGLALGVGIAGAGVGAYTQTAHRSPAAMLALAASCMLGTCIVVAAHVLAARLKRSRSGLAALRDAMRAAQNAHDTTLSNLLVAMNNMSQGLCMFGPDHRLVLSNTRYADLYGLKRTQIRPGMTVPQIVKHRIRAGNVPVMGEAEYGATMQRITERGEIAETIVEQTDGRVFLLGYVPLEDGGWVATHQDITDRRQAEAKIAHLARHDPLTELPNRAAFREALQAAAEQAEKGQGFAILCIDLDRLKAINDTLGHHVGDLLLSEIGKRLAGLVSGPDMVARLSGDEFAAVLTGAKREDAEKLARRIIAAVGEPCQLDGHQVISSASLGIAVAPADGVTPDDLMKSGDMALYRAKAEGRGIYRVFEPEMDVQRKTRRGLEADLRCALTRKEFELNYQPIVAADSGVISGFEALVRWNSAERGSVPPDEFIPLAEETGLIVPLGEWVIRQACSDAATWPDDIRLAVNLSPVQLAGADIVATVRSALAETGLPARRLELEITETVLMQDSEPVLRKLHELRALGAMVSMDDFGTGYSSLSYIRKFPFDRIKIDRTFIHDMIGQEDSSAIVHAVSALGRSLGIATTAEGVETMQQLERIRSEGCTEVQGYLFSEPRPAAEVASILRASRRGNRAVA